MSYASDLVDAWVSQLVSSVPTLADAIIHDNGVPWDPEQFYTDRDELHLAIWPTIDALERQVLSNDAHELSHRMALTVWQDAGEEGGRRIGDRAASRAFLDLHDAILARFYVQSNQWIGSSERTWYERTTYPDAIGTVRWFRIDFAATIYKGFVP